MVECGFLLAVIKVRSYSYQELSRPLRGVTAGDQRCLLFGRRTPIRHAYSNSRYAAALERAGGYGGQSCYSPERTAFDGRQVGPAVSVVGAVSISLRSTVVKMRWALARNVSEKRRYLCIRESLL